MLTVGPKLGRMEGQGLLPINYRFFYRFKGFFINYLLLNLVFKVVKHVIFYFLRFTNMYAKLPVTMSSASREYDYCRCLREIKNAFGKRGGGVTKKLLKVLGTENAAMPLFKCINVIGDRPNNQTDGYSTSILQQYGPVELRQQGRVALAVNGDGNCLFNSVSVALIGEYSVSRLYLRWVKVI